MSACATEAVVPVGTAGSAPRSVAIDTDNNIAVIALVNANSVELLDLDTNTPAFPAPIPVGSNPISVAYDQKNDLALVATHGDASLQMVRYNLERNIATVVGNIFLGSGPLEVTISSELEFAAVAIGPGRAVAVLDTSGIPATLAGLVPLNTAPGSVAINPKTGLVAALLPETRTFSLIDPATLRKLTTPSVFVGANPTHISVNPNNNTVLVANPPRDAVEIVPMGFVNYFPLVSDTSQFRTNLGIRNLDEQEATVSISWGNQEGVSSRERTATVGPRGFLQINNVLRFVMRSQTQRHRYASGLPAGDFGPAVQQLYFPDRQRNPGPVPAGRGLSGFAQTPAQLIHQPGTFPDQAGHHEPGQPQRGCPDSGQGQGDRRRDRTDGRASRFRPTVFT